MRLELMGVTTLMSVVKNAKIFVKTFDGFDVYVNGRLIYFPRCWRFWSKNEEAAYRYPR